MAYALHKDFRQQNRVQWHSLSFVGGWHVTIAMVWARKTKVFNSTSKGLPNGKCGALNTCIYFIVVPFYLTGQSSSLDAVFFTRSVDVVCTLIKDFKDNTGLFYSYDDVENKNKWHFCLKAPYVWARIVFHYLCDIIIQNWIRFNSSGNFKASPSY